MGKFLTLTRSLSRPAYTVLKGTASSGALAEFEAEKQIFERRQMELLNDATHTEKDSSYSWQTSQKNYHY
ncbi:Oidioi.mRNA.OKI2018_I69.chr2.g5735.t1.cds [Oikopleura dioica]|uniref:Oidioi.mRNA.OKI2018_I69.chr2.g5735.t1.cds n=1 Tax=Oikopleura dioica TaxID=34765 RepID=A0ABN7T7T1_OIKDI|nr:Oidioi.mRNA.OKI2018_I69.chr2.g5735.t1.cds [Oikopleura dioica]